MLVSGGLINKAFRFLNLLKEPYGIDRRRVTALGPRCCQEFDHVGLTCGRMGVEGVPLRLSFDPMKQADKFLTRFWAEVLILDFKRDSP